MRCWLLYCLLPGVASLNHWLGSVVFSCVLSLKAKGKRRTWKEVCIERSFPLLGQHYIIIAITFFPFPRICILVADSPRNITLTPTGFDTMQLSWKPPHLNDSADAHVVHFVILCSSDFNFTTTVSDDSLQLDSLTPYTSYTCCVTADTTLGLSAAACETQITLESGMHIQPYIIGYFTLMHMYIIGCASFTFLL